MDTKARSILGGLIKELGKAETFDHVGDISGLPGGGRETTGGQVMDWEFVIIIVIPFSLSIGVPYYVIATEARRRKINSASKFAAR